MSNPLNDSGFLGKMIHPTSKDSVVYLEWYFLFLKWYRWMKNIGFDKEHQSFESWFETFKVKCTVCYNNKQEPYLDITLCTWYNHELLWQCASVMESYVFRGMRKKELNDNPPLPQAEVYFILTQFYCFCQTVETVLSYMSLQDRLSKLENPNSTTAPTAAAETGPMRPNSALSTGLETSGHRTSTREDTRSRPDRTYLHLLLNDLDINHSNRTPFTH